ASAVEGRDRRLRALRRLREPRSFPPDHGFRGRAHRLARDSTRLDRQGRRRELPAVADEGALVTMASDASDVAAKNLRAAPARESIALPLRSPAIRSTNRRAHPAV